MLSTQPSAQQSTPTTSGSERPTTSTARVTLEVALVVELVVDVEVHGEGEAARAAARAAALESQARAAWDAVSLSAARGLLTDVLDRGAPLAAGLTIHRMAGGEAPELLVRRRPEGQG